MEIFSHYYNTLWNFFPVYILKKLRFEIALKQLVPTFLRKVTELAFSIFLTTFCATLPTHAQSILFKQTVAELVFGEKHLSKFYQTVQYEPLWIGKAKLHRDRRKALFEAISAGETHGLPVINYKLPELKKQLKRARSDVDLATIEVRLSKTFLSFAADVQTGILIPNKVNMGIYRKVPYRDKFSYLTNFAQNEPKMFFKALPPSNPEYKRLLREKLKFQKLVAKGGWGEPLELTQLKPGDTSKAVIKLRNRLISMGYLRRTLRRKYDENIRVAVTAFQRDHGLNPDGLVGPATLREINVSASQRLQSILVTLERIRWSNHDLGDRHVLVNLTDFTAKIIDKGIVTFRTRAVVGANDEERRTPEFSDIMELIVVNPTWNVPRSIAVGEYLPELQKNPLALEHLVLFDDLGLPVERALQDFTIYDEETFPFDIKQPPSAGNALGMVKFMFPNKHNIYLHDTPEKDLFSKDRRTFSHGCVRLQQPFKFAHTLLAPQVPDPVKYFEDQLMTGVEITINLTNPVPVHLIYRTTLAPAKGRINFRNDIYGRDADIWLALAAKGVVLQPFRR